MVGRNTRRRALVDTNSGSIIKGRMVLLRNFNAHSPDSNIHYGKRRDMTELERLLDTHDLILNNEPGKAKRLTLKKPTSIIYLIFTTPKIGALETLIIDEEISMLSGHEVIVCDLAG